MLSRAGFTVATTLLAVSGVACSGTVSTPTTTELPLPSTAASAPTTTMLATTTTEPAASTTTRPLLDEPFVEIDGARLVYRCVGDGVRTVLVEQWSYGPNSNAPDSETFMGWQAVVDGVSDSVRICVYNRRGVGNSDRARDGVSNRTTQDSVNDLIGVIETLDLGPTVMVGHSYGGMNIQLLADQRPDLLVGAVYVDAVHPEAFTAVLGYGPAEPPEYIDAWASFQQVTGKGDMGDKPVYVITAGEFFDTDEENAAWHETHKLLAAMSTNSVHVLLPDSGHSVPGSHPAAIIDAINWVLAELD